MLPDKWSVHRTPETYKQINDYFSSITGFRYSLPSGFMNQPAIEDEYSSQQLPNGYTLISFPEFIKYIKNNSVVKSSGYREFEAPFPIFEDRITKGDIFVSEGSTYSCRKDNTVYSLPREIVEKWDPVTVLSMGSPLTTIRITKKHVVVLGNVSFSTKELTRIINEQKKL